MNSPTRKFIFTALLVVCFVAGCTTTDRDIVEVFDVEGSSLGSVAIHLTCTLDANEHVRRGLALLHNMTYEEAGTTFAAATEMDPGCSMAKWGQAMSLFHPIWPDVPTDETLRRGAALLADARSTNPTGIESAYVAAAEAYFDGGNNRTEPERLQAYAAGWEDVGNEYPNDIEAKLFQALSQIGISGASGDRVAIRAKAGELAESVLVTVPDHPGGLHYIIHAFDLPELADRALEVARLYGKVAPENSHALHMTSHIFTRVGSWDESIAYNTRAGEAALKHPIDGAVSIHYLHSADYLVYAHLQRGDDASAASVWKNIAAIDGPVQDHAASAYAFAAVPARQALERHNWNAAKKLNLDSATRIDWVRYPHLEAIVTFARGMGGARSGDLAVARAALRRLQVLEDAADTLPGSYNWGEQVEIQWRTLQAWILFAEGDTESAVNEMRVAAELEATTIKNPVTPGEVLPAAELFGDMLLELEQPAEALKSYEQSLARTRNRLNSLYGAAIASEQLGDSDGAKKFYQQIVSMADESATLESVERAREVAGV